MPTDQSDGAASAGDPWRRLLGQVWRLAFPVLLTNLLQSVVGVVDVFMTGRLGPVAIAAVGMGAIIRTLVLVMVLAVAGGAMSLIAQATGARDPVQMSRVTRQSISSGFLLSLLLMVVGLAASGPLLRLANSGGDPEAVRLGEAYLQIVFLGMPFLVLNVVFNRLMQGAGDTVTPLLLTAALNGSNILFNYLFMFGPGPLPAFGLSGAAMATVLSRGIGVVVALAIIYRGLNVVKILPGSYRPEWRMFADILAIGVPSGIQGLFRNGSRLLVLSILTSTEVGTFGAAALAIGLQVESLAFMPVLGLNVAATSLVGQALGRWQTNEARRRGDMAIAIGVVLMLVLVIPIVLLAPAIIRLFDPSAQPIVLDAGTRYLRINTVALPAVAIAMVANGALRGAGDTTPGMVSTLVGRGVVSVLVAYVLAHPLGMGSQGVFFGLAIGMLVDAVFMGLRWRGRAWLRVALQRTELFRRHLVGLPEALQEQFLRDVRRPHMAAPGALEEVVADGVVYRLRDRETRFRFGAAGYERL